MKVLVVAAHPDDEVLGCGGTIARHVANGDQVCAMFLTDGVGARGQGDDVAVRRREACQRASAILGITADRHEGLPDNELDGLPLLGVVRAVEFAVLKIKPDIVYTHHAGDLNIDHRIAHQAVSTACRPVPGSTVKAIYAFEVPSSTEWGSDGDLVFRPNHFVDISKMLETKMTALEAYAEEMRPFPHPRSMKAVRALAQWRGATVGLVAAEAFMTVRRIEI